MALIWNWLAALVYQYGVYGAGQPSYHMFRQKTIMEPSGKFQTCSITNVRPADWLRIRSSRLEDAQTPSMRNSKVWIES